MVFTPRQISIPAYYSRAARFRCRRRMRGCRPSSACASQQGRGSGAVDAVWRREVWRRLLSQARRTLYGGRPRPHQSPNDCGAQPSACVGSSYDTRQSRGSRATAAVWRREVQRRLPSQALRTLHGGRRAVSAARRRRRQPLNDWNAQPSACVGSSRDTRPSAGTRLELWRQSTVAADWQGRGAQHTSTSEPACEHQVANTLSGQSVLQSPNDQ